MKPNPTLIRRAEVSDLQAVVPLFDAYRQFYQQASDLVAARSFLQARLEQRDSVIFVAEIDFRSAGFTQLYPSFSSVSMKRLWILNDLFVHPDYRRRGVGRALLTAAEEFARGDGAKGLSLATAKSNAVAKAAYAAAGWKQDLAFDHHYLYF
jgi:ribosomal protein S18 acetylase RimI-like enzyme